MITTLLSSLGSKHGAEAVGPAIQVAQASPSAAGYNMALPSGLRAVAPRLLCTNFLEALLRLPERYTQAS